MALFINISVSDTFRHILQHRKISHSIGAINHMSSNIAKKIFGQKLGENLCHCVLSKILALKKEVDIIERRRNGRRQNVIRHFSSNRVN